MYRRGTPTAVLTLVIGGLIAGLLGTGWITIVRDVFHYRCEYQSDGEYSAWVCADGIGYLGALVVILLMQAATIIVAVVLVTVRRDRPGVWRLLAAVAVCPVLLFGAVTLLAGGTLSDLSPGQLVGISCAGVAALAGVVAAILGPRRVSAALLGFGVAAGIVTGVSAPALLPLAAIAIAIGIASWVTMPQQATA